MRRVVVTGLGLVTPLGCGVDATWKRLLAGESGARRVAEFEVDDLSCQIASFVPRGDGSDGTFNADDWMEPKEQRKVDDFIVYSVAAADQAIADAAGVFDDDDKREDVGVLIGSGIGGLQGIAETSLLLRDKGPRRISPFFIPGRLINLASGYVSINHGLKGPNICPTTACASGTHGIGEALRLIQDGHADAMVCGGAESTISKLGIASFTALKALSTNNDEAETASRPFDLKRDGFVMGEGAGILVLEEYSRAKDRGAKIFAEVVGYGLSGDGHHITAPAPEGEGGQRCMQMALETGGLKP